MLTASVASVWAVLLSISDGWSRLSAPLRTRHEYVPFASGLDDPAEFVRSFTDHLPAYPVHVRGHPPGATLVFWGMDRIGLSGAGWAAVLVVIAWAVAVGAVVVCVAELAGRAAARRAAPFVALVPAAVWAGTSVDAMFAGVAALGVALIVVSCGRGGGTAVAVAIAGGAVLALALHLSYGVAPLLALPAAVVVWRHRLDVVLSALAGGALVTALWVGAGFWWFDGLAATRDAYWSGVAATRSWPYHLIVGNPAALALAAGPAIAVAAGWARRAPLAIWLVAAVTFGALAVADAVGLVQGGGRTDLAPLRTVARLGRCGTAREEAAGLAARPGRAGGGAPSCPQEPLVTATQGQQCTSW